ncbi:oligosaccharide flippase family protein [Klenkia sp. LSe6-5]|uniref:Oligosaccharide flippase family protein n=1 Tax=Klenkia sesuvii TaxID=3103137 RepID=A0ABU8DW11_9ACTN
MTNTGVTRSSVRQARSFLAYGAGPMVGLVTAPLLARALGPNGRGEFAAIMLVITVAGAVASFGIPAATSVFVSRGYPVTEVNRISQATSLVCAVPVYIAVVLYGRLVAERLGLSWPVLAVFYLAVIASASVQSRRGLWQGSGQIGRLDLERAVYATLRLLGVVLLFSVGSQSAPAFAASSLLAFLVASSVIWTRLPSRRPAMPAEPNSQSVAAKGAIGPTRSRDEAVSRHSFMRYSATAAVGTIALVANSRLDQVILPSLTTLQEFGFYSVAVTLAEVPLIAGTLLARDLIRRAVAEAKVKDLLRRTIATQIIGVALVVAIAVLLFPAVPLLYGDAFRPVIPATLILLMATVITMYAQGLIAILQGRGRPAKSSVASVAGLVATVMGYVYVGLGATAIDAAFITLVTQGVTLVAASLLLRFGGASEQLAINKVRGK